MGFPVGYTEFFIPNLVLHFFTFLNLIRHLISKFFKTVEYFQEPEYYSHDPNQTGSEMMTHFQSVSSLLIRELLPVIKYEELVDPPESCVVCLHEFETGDEIRRLMNCQHVFHRDCLDRWMDGNKKTCPLCRTMFVPEELLDSFNERLWAASGIGEYYGHDSLVV